MGTDYHWPTQSSKRPAPKVNAAAIQASLRSHKVTQNEAILNWLEKNNGGITHVQALALFGCARLAARIDDLRNLGHNIITETVKQNGKSFARYHLAKGK